MINDVEKRNIFILVGTIILITVIFLACLMFNMIKIDKIDIEKINIDKDSSNIEYSIDEYEEKNNRIFIRGWIIDKNVNSKYIQYSIIFKNLSSDTYYKVKTFSEHRNDVTIAMNDGHDYNFSGFNGKILKLMLPEKGEYEVYILFTRYDKTSIIKIPYTFYKEALLI